MYTFWSTVCTKSIIDNNWVQRTLRIWWNYVIIAFVNSFVNICSIYENHLSSLKYKYLSIYLYRFDIFTFLLHGDYEKCYIKCLGSNTPRFYGTKHIRHTLYEAGTRLHQVEDFVLCSRLRTSSSIMCVVLVDLV